MDFYRRPSLLQLNKMNTKMNTKRTLVSFLLVASVLLLASAVSAAPIADIGNYHNISVKVDGSDFAANGLSTANAGDTLTIQTQFTYTGTSDDSIKLKATLEGYTNDVTSSTSSFNIEAGQTYTQTLTLTVPSDFASDSVTGDFPLTIQIGDEEVSLGTLHVQKPSYDVAIKSVMADSTLAAGTSVPVQVLLKNDGYNDLSDLYLTVGIPELNIQKTVYVGDLVNVQNVDTNNDQKNTASATVYLDIPYDAKAGADTLSVIASNDDTKTTATQAVTITNSIPDVAMKSGNDLVLLNPTNQLKVYTVAYNSNTESVVVPAASSKTVSIDTPTNGDYKFDVTVSEGTTVLDTVNFSGSAQSAVELTSPVFVLTVVLAIVFLVLLVVLVVLITKKPQKTEEFGESYY